ncbi:bifunctional non-homologous end joining protein LigD [Fodinibius roseus]|uniref:Bifunctional non-homologous end joining protein LigD n=1 Tax=Fodinibius roseus TaxID=1194090 RepID=A0A1M5BXF0_9BACT|nr:non-homologous end-joining DNA ligase [Fodinibius roseus]SHF47263.1 bifunctional non-homologous end joining protein LigD [Fodinibius roseus]
MQYGPYSIDIKKRGKVFFPENNITKGDLIDYYDKIADYLLPFLRDRPLTLSRFPDGINEDGFYQKEAPDYFPDWIESIEVTKKEGGEIQQVICNNKATLIYLVNQGTISFHPWLSTTTDLNRPNKLVFDLDPPQGNFDLVLEGAKFLRSLLEKQLGLNAFVMTTGSEGLHVLCPLRVKKGFDEIRSFARDVAEYMAREQPDTFTVATRKKKREGRLFVDYLRNAYGQTSISPFSLRTLEGAPVATPLDWGELDRDNLTSQSYHIKNTFRRLSQKDDSWDYFQQKAKGLGKSMDKLKTMLK